MTSHPTRPNAPVDASAAYKLALELFVAGYEGTTVPASYRQRLADGLAGTILFKRNLEHAADGLIDVANLAAHNEAIHSAGHDGPTGLPVISSVDQEGGLVARLRAPFTHLPPMRTIGETGDHELAHAAGAQTGRECFAAGFNVDFAPILDIDTNPDNPIIGNRAFGRDAESVIQMAGAFGRGLTSEGVLGCGKHFPGHGDTDVDSHLALPVLHHDLARLTEVELAPFKALAAELPMVMTAHILFPALDEELPATLSPRIIEGLLRKACGYDGVIVSDDLEMKGVAATFSSSESVTLGLAAGVDLFLVCRKEDALEEAVAAAAKILRDGGDCAAKALRAIERVRKLRQTLQQPAPSVAAIRRAIGHEDGDGLRMRLGIGTVSSSDREPSSAPPARA